jgi:putative tryptophan/tyrosine transport system substrate-binding protein
MRRREFMAGLGSAATWPLAVRAQQPPRLRRIGVLLSLPPDDPILPVRVTAFAQALQELGWTDGRNMGIDYRFAGSDPDRIRRFGLELAVLEPDLLVAEGAIVTHVLQQVARTVPIVFVLASDPVGEGLVASLARPGGNTTGFALWEYGIGVKWLQLLKEIAPNVTRAAVIRDRSSTAQTGQFGAMQGVAPMLRMQLSPIDAREPVEIERGITAFAREPNGGLIVPTGAWPAAYREVIVMLAERHRLPAVYRGSNGGLIVTTSTLAQVHRELIITLAARHRLPAVYPFRFFVTGGGLISYGHDTIDQYRRAAGYVDRILKGEKPADLPVQMPTKYVTVLNLKTAKALGITVPETLLATADEVIQ